jgi:hypothetical protein
MEDDKMDNIKDEFGQTIKITGIFGILCFAGMPITMILYFMYDVPPIWNVLLRVLVVIINSVMVLIFFTGFQHIIKTIQKKYEWLITLMYNTVCICIAIIFVAHSLEAGGVLNSAGTSIDATQEGILAQGTFLLYGSISRLLMAIYMSIIGIITLKTKIFPLWIGRLAIIIGIINLLFVPSMFFGTNNADFYSAAGWGNAAITHSLFVWWVLIMGIALLKDKNKYKMMI